MKTTPVTNPRKEIESRSRLDHCTVPFTADEVREAIPHAVNNLINDSYYAPLIERCPIRVDEQVPVMKRRDILKHESCACTDANNVYVLSDEMAKTLNEAAEEFKDDYTNKNLITNVASFLAHEYTHVLCCHQNVGKSMGKLTNAERTCFVLACEIEANRGHKVDLGYQTWDGNTRHTLVYRLGATDDKIPETKNDRFLPQIYATLLKMYKDKKKELEQFLQQIMNNDMAEAMSGNGNGGKKKKGTKNGNSNKNKIQGQSQTSTGTGKMDGSTTADGSVNRQQNGTGNDGENKDKTETEWDELTQEQIEESIKKANEVVKQVQSQSVGQGDETGYGLESAMVEYKPELTPQDNLERNYERWNEKRVKKEISKMKGLIRGNISKNKEKTYARPTRRPIQSNGLIRKGVRYEKSYSPKVLIAMDSSGSMCSTTMKEVACAIENIFKDLGKPKTGSYICKHESNVSDVKPMRQWKEVVESYRPCGGNCFLHVAEEANRLGVDVVLNIGDGQDCVYRDYPTNSDEVINKFKAEGRQWFDVLVTNKNENRYYQEEAYYDEQKGFHREGIYLGDKIEKYLGKAS